MTDISILGKRQNPDEETDVINGNDMDSNENMNKEENNRDESNSNLQDRAERNRERNREHAKRTRLRKKEMIESMKMRLLDLQREAAELEQLLEESNTANILMHMGVNVPNSDNPVDDMKFDKKNRLSVPKGNIVDQLRYRVRAEAAKTMREKLENSSQTISGQSSRAPSEEGGETGSSTAGLTTSEYNKGYSSMIESEKSGAENCSDTNHNRVPSFASSFGGWKTAEQLEREIDEEELGSKPPPSADTTRRERNRMHAKLTRDRKKLFTHRMQQLISALERHNMMMRGRLGALIHSGNAQMNLPAAPVNLFPASLPHPFNPMANSSNPSLFPNGETLVNDSTDKSNMTDVRQPVDKEDAGQAPTPAVPSIAQLSNANALGMHQQSGFPLAPNLLQAAGGIFGLPGMMLPHTASATMLGFPAAAAAQAVTSQSTDQPGKTPGIATGSLPGSSNPTALPAGFPGAPANIMLSPFLINPLAFSSNPSAAAAYSQFMPQYIQMMQLQAAAAAAQLQSQQLQNSLNREANTTANLSPKNDQNTDNLTSTEP